MTTWTTTHRDAPGFADLLALVTACPECSGQGTHRNDDVDPPRVCDGTAEEVMCGECGDWLCAPEVAAVETCWRVERTYHLPLCRTCAAVEKEER